MDIFSSVMMMSLLPSSKFSIAIEVIVSMRPRSFAHTEILLELFMSSGPNESEDVTRSDGTPVSSGSRYAMHGKPFVNSKTQFEVLKVLL